jgi:hypothetical protein
MAFWNPKAPYITFPFVLILGPLLGIDAEATSVQIRVVNTMKPVWGENAEEQVFSVHGKLGRCYNSLPAVSKPAGWLNLPKAYNSTFSMLLFIAGPHTCDGKTMSIIDMKAVVASVITHLQSEPAFVGQYVFNAAPPISLNRVRSYSGLAKPTVAVIMSALFLSVNLCVLVNNIVFHGTSRQ